eukprot:g3498.t1
MGFRWPWTILLLGQQVAAHRCGGRVDWLVQHEDLSKDEAGFRVAKEFPVECWRCGLNISSASSKSCSLQESTSDTLQLQQLQMMNCGKVQKASVQFQDGRPGGLGSRTGHQVKVWRQKSSLAGELCRESTVLLDHEEFKSAALVAMYAWSEVIMDGSQCCELLRPPYCLQAQWSWATLAVAILLGGSFLALISSLIAALTAKAPRPAAPHFAESAASLFAQLYKRFGFQADNVRNQFDHLLSLWRSHCAMLADLDLEVEDEEELEEAVVNEKTLLHEALNSMHAELLEGFRAWRHRLSEELQEPLSRSSVTLCQVRWAQVPLGDWLDSESSPKHLAASLAMKHLAEVVTYLLVWGEAGNLRFMPEVIYFLTELTLGADGEPYQVEGPTSCCFLSRMIRPSYKVIFDDEIWSRSRGGPAVTLGVSRGSQDRASGVGPEEREKLPTFHTGYEAFLPPDAANYDDWNEFFANVGLLRRGMARLFESEHPKRFAVFQEFNLSKMLSSQKTKTHREVHSFWGVIWLLHTLLFFTGLCVVAEEPKDDAETLAGHGIAVRFSGLGLLAPLHALMLMVARIYTSGPALRSSIRGIGCMCAHLSRGLLWLSPLVTYLAVRFSQGIDIDQQIIRYLLIAHGLVSVWALISLLFFANRTSDVPYQVRPRRLCRLQVVRYFFWFVVLAAKFLIAVVLFRAVFELILDLQLEPLGRATSRDVLIAWYSTVWTRDLLIWIWLWFSSFFIFCADTQLWFTVGCSLLGVAAFLSQRGCRVCHFALEDAVHELPWRFQEKVLRYAPSAKQAFAKTWNLVIHHMTKEQKINVRDSGELSYDYVMSEEPEPPVLFNRENCLERASKHYCYMSDTREWPVNKELQWRFLALSRGPGKFREPILLQPEDLYSEAPGEARDLGHLIDYLRIKYMDEFKNLAQNFSVPGGVRNWSRYSPPQWKATCIWASMRLQTLWRTVAGICKYHDALLLLHELQGTCSGLLWHPEDTSDVFRCLVSMQLYSYSSSVQREQVNEMLERFPPNLKIAYIDHEDTDECLLMPGGQRAWQPRRPPMVATEDAALASEDPLGDGQWTTPSASVQPRSQPEEWEWGDENWEAADWSSNPWNDEHWETAAWEADPWSHPSADPWSGGSRDGWMSDAELRNFNVAKIDQMTAINNGRWAGSYDFQADWPDRAWKSEAKPSEKLVVPEFDGEGINDAELGRSARSYVRRVQVWLRCTKMPPEQRALALYTALTGKAWVYAEELDVDMLAMETGVSYFLEWIQTRFMEVELTKISQIMNELFRRCRRRNDQSVRDFNVEFERLVLRLHEVRCELPPLIKGWLYLDKLRLSESEELALLSSVNNTYDVRRLQQAALVQDRALRRPGGGDQVGKMPEKGGWNKRWTKHSVHMTNHDESSEDDEGEPQEVEELVDEDTAYQQHTAYLAYQGAKAKYREALRGRGADLDELKKRSEERLRLAKQRSYCSVCKRKGHWHRDAECPMRGQARPSRSDDKPDSGKAVQSAQMCQVVYLTEGDFGTGGLHPPYGRLGPEMLLTNEPNTIEETFVLENLQGGLDGGVDCDLRQSCIAETTKETCGRTVEQCLMTEVRQSAALPAGPADSFLAIVDTACTKSVAGHDWFERYADWAAAHGYEVCTEDREEHFSSGTWRNLRRPTTR